MKVNFLGGDIDTRFTVINQLYEAQVTNYTRCISLFY